ncbi:MAG: hypothetical protein MI757_09345 [Pirellulales bacterium]|nr:hypothetical protein [Pirellulales bacterium]
MLRALLLSACCLSPLVLAQPTFASTAAFAGKVTEVREAKPNEKDVLGGFTVEIDYFDYCSWNKFGRDSKVGESISRRVKKLGSACVINGRLVNAATFAKAIKPGTWGYFYEDTWLDLQTTPDFQWGEVIKKDGDGQFTLRVHRTHKAIHLDANPPIEEKVSFDGDTLFRLEDKPADADTALKPGNWVQVHPARPQIVTVWTKDAKFDPAELLPASEGKRGYANDLTCAAVLKKVTAKNPAAVLDLSCEVTATRTLKGKTEDATIGCRSVSFVLDGKLAPVSIAARPGREAVLCHYRNQDRPHKILVRSKDDAIRGTVASVDGRSLTIKTPDGEKTVKLDADAKFQLDGVAVDQDNVKLVGNALIVYPKRARIFIAFEPQKVD